MFKSVLLPLDGSVLAARALPYAKRVARAAGARLIVVRAHLPADDLGLRLEYPELSPGLNGCRAHDRGSGISNRG